MFILVTNTCKHSIKFYSLCTGSTHKMFSKFFFFLPMIIRIRELQKPRAHILYPRPVYCIVLSGRIIRIVLLATFVFCLFFSFLFMGIPPSSLCIASTCWGPGSLQRAAITDGCELLGTKPGPLEVPSWLQPGGHI